MRFVVIGGDAAGMSAASRAKRHDPDLHVVVLEQTSDVSYSACGMPYNIAEPHRAIDDLIVRKPAVFREKHHIDLRLGHRAVTIDRDSRQVLGKTAEGEDFAVEYDKVLVATGARPRRMGLPGEDLPGVHALKSLQDGRNIKEYLTGQGVRRGLIVGIGYVGLEMAEALRTRGIEVIMTKPRSRLLPWMPEEMAGVVRRELEENKVQFRFGSDVDRIEATDSGLRVSFGEGRSEDVDFVLLAVGVDPNSEIASDAGLELGPGASVAVDRGLRTSDPDIFAAGDCADAFHVVTGERVWIPLALRANRAGWAVADNVLGKEVELPGIVGTAVFKTFDLEVARTGLSLKEAQDHGFDAVEQFIRSRTRAHAHPGAGTIHVSLVGDRQTGRLLGGTMVGQEGAAHRIDSVAVALHAGMSVYDFYQCDLAYAPPFGPVWDPMLTAANQLLKQFS